MLNVSQGKGEQEEQMQGIMSLEGWGEWMRVEATVRTYAVSRDKDADRDISERCEVTVTSWESTGRSGQMP